MFYRRRPYRRGYYRPFRPIRPYYWPYYRLIGFRPLRAFGCLFTLGIMSMMSWLLLAIIF